MYVYTNINLDKIGKTEVVKGRDDRLARRIFEAREVGRKRRGRNDFVRRGKSHYRETRILMGTSNAMDGRDKDL